MEDGINEYRCPPQAGPAVVSSQSGLNRGVRAVGELKGGVTGALIEPLGMYRCGNLADDADDDAAERFLSHGIRDVPSSVFFALAANDDDVGLGKEDEVGLGL